MNLTTTTSADIYSPDHVGRGFYGPIISFTPVKIEIVMVKNYGNSLKQLFQRTNFSQDKWRHVISNHGENHIDQFISSQFQTKVKPVHGP